MTTDGKFFAADGKRFLFRGWHERASDEERTPTALLRDAGFTLTVVESFDPILLSTAADDGLYAAGEIRLPPWRALAEVSRRETRRLVKSTAREVELTVSGMRGDEHVVGAIIRAQLEPDDPPAPTHVARRILNELARAIRDCEPDLLVGACLPRAVRECPIELDFLLTAPHPQMCLSSAIGEAHLLVGDRPLVLYAVDGPNCVDVRSYRAIVDEAATQGAAGTILACNSVMERTALLGSPASRSAIARLNSRTVAHLEIDWPPVSIVICAYNAAETLEECLRNVALLDYPRLEVIVVDDGSIDETAEIAERHPGVRLIRLDHAGLSEARNVGFRSARGELVAYLDADAYPSREWVHFLVLGSLGDRVVASGGPNVPPPDDPPGAQVVAHCPGAPIPVLYRPDRALHIPGCNMAFRRQVLEQLGGFAENFTSAADDTDLQLRLRQRGLELGYHPAALVWHRRRPGVRKYLRQQWSYGRSQALATIRNPAYFRRYRRRKLYMALGRARAEEPDFLAVSYRSLWWRRRQKFDLAHQWGIPAATALIATAPLGLKRRILFAPAAAGTAWLALLFGLDVALAIRDVQWHPRRLLTAMRVAALQMLRPPAFVSAMLTQAAFLRLRQARPDSR